MTHHDGDFLTRSPAVAGKFYPAEPRNIQRTLDEWCADAGEGNQAWHAALIPHAGWVYSGRIAAVTLSRIVMPRTIVVVCPKHRAEGAECAVAPWKRWQFPGGYMEADVAMSRRLADEVRGLELDDRPHRQEHAIEVQIPLLARSAPQSQIVGITIGRIDLVRCEAMATDLAELLRDRLDDVLLLISSDMNHFADDAQNRRLDELALKTLDHLDPRQLFDTCREHHITMCGLIPTVLVLTALKRLDALHRAVRVDYATSAEVSGDTRRVVGYAGMLFG